MCGWPVGWCWQAVCQLRVGSSRFDPGTGRRSPLARGAARRIDRAFAGAGLGARLPRCRGERRGGKCLRTAAVRQPGGRRCGCRICRCPVFAAGGERRAGRARSELPASVRTPATRSRSRSLRLGGPCADDTRLQRRRLRRASAAARPGACRRQHEGPCLREHHSARTRWRGSRTAQPGSGVGAAARAAATVEPTGASAPAASAGPDRSRQRAGRCRVGQVRFPLGQFDSGGQHHERRSRPRRRQPSRGPATPAPKRAAAPARRQSAREAAAAASASAATCRQPRRPTPRSRRRPRRSRRPARPDPTRTPRTERPGRDARRTTGPARC